MESRGEILTRREDILSCLTIIYTKLGMPTAGRDARADRNAARRDSLTLYRLPLENLGGIRCGLV